MLSNTKVSKVQKAGIGYTIGNYLLRGLGFITIPIFSRILSTTDYGIYNTYMSFEGILFIIIGLALHSSFKNANIKYGLKFNEYVSSCIILCIFNFLFLIFLGNILCLFIPKYGHVYISLLVAHSFASAIITYFNDYLSISYSYKIFLLVSFVNSIGNISISVLLILTIFHENRAYGRIIGTIIPLLLIAIFVVFGFFKQSKPRNNREYWIYGLKYSLPIIPHGISQVILGSFDRIMISTMVGNSEAGLYSFAYNVYSIISVTYSSLGTVWGPWFYEKMHANKLDEIKNVSKKYIWTMGIFSAGIMVISPEIISILGTEAYHDSIYLTAPIICGCFFSFLYTLPAQIEYYYEKTKYIAVGTFCAAMLNIVLNYIFITRYGYSAAVYTTFATYAAYFLFHYFISERIEKRKVYDTKVFIFIIVFEVFMCIFTQILIAQIILRWIAGIILGIFFLVFINISYKISKYNE